MVLDLKVANPAQSTAPQCRIEGADRRDLTREFSLETERIQSELLKLGIVVRNRSIGPYRWWRHRPDDHQRWRTFLSNQLRSTSAALFERPFLKAGSRGTVVTSFGSTAPIRRPASRMTQRVKRHRVA